LTDSLVYNIPAALVRAYRGRNLIVRSDDPSEIVASLADVDRESVSYVQILFPGGETESLMRWGNAIPVDLVVRDPQRDLPRLYHYSPLLARHPVRVTVPVVSGFSNVVKLATSLNFAVKLEGSQPDSALVEELSRVAHSYLHQETVSEPIDYFHSLFLAFYREDPVTLWAIQEEDPARSRFITDAGEETISHRFPAVHPPGDLASFVRAFRESILAEQGECCRCDFLEPCSAYFKWPRKDYGCDGVKGLLQTLKTAAHQLREDLASYHAPSGGEQS
jgi:hypothetical protein